MEDCKVYFTPPTSKLDILKYNCLIIILFFCGAKLRNIFLSGKKSLGSFFVYKKSFLSLHRKNLHYEIL